MISATSIPYDQCWWYSIIHLISFEACNDLSR